MKSFIKKLLSFILVGLMVVVPFGSAVHADGETPCYTLDTTKSENQTNNNGYASAADCKVADITWNFQGNGTMNPWRIGGKSLTNADRSVYTKTALAENIKRIDLTVGNASSITVNSIKLVYSTSSDFSNSNEISGTFTANSTITFEIKSGTFGKNNYYKFVFNVSVTVKDNKFIEFKKVEFFNEIDEVKVNEISLSKSSLELKEGESSTLTATVSPDNATNKSVTWNSSVPSVATVVDGKVTAIKEGTTIITAEAGGKSATCEVTVKENAIARIKNMATKTQLQYGYVKTVDPNKTKTETIDFSSKGYSNQVAVNSVSSGNVTISFNKGTNSNNAPKYYTTGTAVRCYAGNTITISANDLNITNITFTFGDSDGSNAITSNVGSFSSPNWTVERSEVVFTIGGTSGNRRIAKIEVVYEDSKETYKYKDVKLNFGAIVDAETLLKIEDSGKTISKYGVAVARKSKLGSNTITDAFKANNDYLAISEKEFDWDTVSWSNENGLNSDPKDYIIFTANLNLPMTEGFVDEKYLTEEFIAVAYIVIDNEVYFLKETEAISVQSLATLYVNKVDDKKLSLDEKIVASLEWLKELK